MAFELERILYETEDFLRRNIASSSRREAKRRKAKRRLEEYGRRTRRALLLLAGLMAAMLAWSILVSPLPVVTWFFGGLTIFFIAFISIFWETKQAPPPVDAAGVPSLPLAELAARAEEGLLDRCNELPGRALPAADAIMARLAELQPHLGALDPQSVLAGDARRLIGQHLPRLVDSYLELPPSSRAAGSESSQRFTESVNIVANELDSLLDACCRDRQLSFDTQRRFIETRYKGDGRLRGD